MNFTIQNEYITLSQLLKVCHVIDSGGQVKGFLSMHSVKVNDEVENRRGRKLYKGDVVEIENHRIVIE